MNNELLLILSLVLIYTCVVLFYRFLGRSGLYCWTVLATIAANIEVLIVVDAFGMEQTLGNILFASTFLVTDILSETEGKRAANKAVLIGILTSGIFILISQSWLLYTPNASDWASPAIASVFSNTPRLMLSSIVVYAIVQAFDVFAYHAIWAHTTKRCNDSKKISVAQKQWLHARLTVFQYTAVHLCGILGRLRIQDFDEHRAFQLRDLHFHQSSGHSCSLHSKKAVS